MLQAEVHKVERGLQISEDEKRRIEDIIAFLYGRPDLKRLLLEGLNNEQSVDGAAGGSETEKQKLTPLELFDDLDNMKALTRNCFAKEAANYTYLRDIPGYSGAKVAIESFWIGVQLGLHEMAESGKSLEEQIQYATEELNSLRNSFDFVIKQRGSLLDLDGLNRTIDSYIAVL